MSRNVHKNLAYFNIGEHYSKMLKTITKHKRKFICINDGNTPIDFDRTKIEIQNAFEQILPEQASFEK